MGQVQEGGMDRDVRHSRRPNWIEQSVSGNKS